MVVDGGVEIDVPDDVEDEEDKLSPLVEGLACWWTTENCRWYGWWLWSSEIEDAAWFDADVEPNELWYKLLFNNGGELQSPWFCKSELHNLETINGKNKNY